MHHFSQSEMTGPFFLLWEFTGVECCISFDGTMHWSKNQRQICSFMPTETK